MSDNTLAIPGIDSTQIDLNQLVQAAQLTAMNVSGISQQMGLMTSKVNNLEAIVANVNNRLTSHERTVTLTNYQTKAMYQAVHARVASLLGGIKDPYYGAICRKLWNDAKKYSKMAQDYKFTLQVDYDEVMNYIGSWYPHGYSGVDDYKLHLDEVRTNKADTDG